MIIHGDNSLAGTIRSADLALLPRQLWADHIRCPRSKNRNAKHPHGRHHLPSTSVGVARGLRAHGVNGVVIWIFVRRRSESST